MPAGDSSGAHAPGDVDASERRAYDELQCYTLAHGDPAFVHQHVVDAWAAQHADGNTKPIAITFALVGLCLHVEHGKSGRQVQRTHMDLARRNADWPALTLPADRGSITAKEVLSADPGVARDGMIDAWCASVWNAYGASHGAIVAWLGRYGVLP